MTKDIIIRAAKTFIQAFLGAVTVDSAINKSEDLKSVFLSLTVAGISAGVSAVWNMLLNIKKEV